MSISRVRAVRRVAADVFLGFNQLPSRFREASKA